MNEVKSGFKTTEFWLTLVPLFLGVLAVFGVFTPTETTQMNAGLTQIIGGIFAVLPVIGYTISRGEVKKAVNGGK